jgi:hypothetical protein
MSTVMREHDTHGLRIHTIDGAIEVVGQAVHEPTRYIIAVIEQEAMASTRMWSAHGSI